MKKGMKSLNQRRMEHMGLFIDLSVKNIINDRIESLLKSRHITPSVLSSKLAETLRECIYNEQEQQLQDLMDQIEQVTAEKNKYEIELTKLKKKSAVKNALLEDQNMMLRDRYDKVNNKIQAYQSKLSQLPDDPEITFHKQQQELHRNAAILKKTQEACHTLKEELEDIKRQTKKNLAQQVKYVQVILPTVIHKLTKSLSSQGVSESRKETADLQVKLSEIEKENQQLKAVCSTLFQTLHEINPKCKAFKSLSLNDVEGNSEMIHEVECGIREIPSIIKKETRIEIEKQLYTLYPQYQPIDDRWKDEDVDINRIVLQIIEKERIRKDKEYDAQLRHLQKKERELRRRLQESIDVVPKKEIKTELSTIIKANENDQMHFNWEKLKRSLDMKMSELDSTSSSSVKKSKNSTKKNKSQSRSTVRDHSSRK